MDVLMPLVVLSCKYGILIGLLFQALAMRFCVAIDVEHENQLRSFAMKTFGIRLIVKMLSAIGILLASSQSNAAAFQLWEQDGASVGNYHAGYAVLANNASIAFYNPAGIPLIKNQQLSLGSALITSSFKYKGSVNVMELSLPPASFPSVTAQGGSLSVVPNLHYVAPITDWLGFGFSIDVPFGLKTDYRRTSPLKYAATLTSISVIDYSPSLGAQLTDKFSLGLGLDIQSATAEFDNVGFIVTLPGTGTQSVNKVSGTGYGFHAGALYQFNEQSRLGLSYHSQVVHRLTGTSKFMGPVAAIINDDQDLISNNTSTKFTLPPYTALSGYQRINTNFAVMATVIYTQWNKIRTIVLNNVAGAIMPLGPSTSIQVILPTYYHNTWNFSLGGDYYVNDQWTIRGAVGYDQTPVKETYRTVQLPDNDRYIVAVGGHYQATKTIGLDLGWTHLFVDSVGINPPVQTTGAQIVATNGTVSGGADVFGAQLTWDIT